MRSLNALNYYKYFSKKKLKKLPLRIRYRGWFLLKILEQRKIRTIYGNITLNRLKNMYQKLIKVNGNFFINFLKSLEYRLDIIVFRLNLFTTLKYCQYLIKTNKILLNNNIRNIHYIVKAGDIIKIKTKNTFSNSNYLLNFKYRDQYYNKIKQTQGHYLYRFLLNLNIFKNLKQVYFYIRKGLIYVNDLKIKFPRYKLAFKKTKISIQKFGKKKKLNFKLKEFFYNIKPRNKFYNTIFKNLNINYYKTYLFIIYNNLYFINKSTYNKKSSLNNFILNNNRLLKSLKKYKYNKGLTYNYKKQNWCISSVINIKHLKINKKFLFAKYKKPLFIKYKWARDLKLKHKIKNKKSFCFVYNFRKKNIFVFKVKRKIFFLNDSKIFLNKYFRRYVLRKNTNFKYTSLVNKNFFNKNYFLKKYSINKVQHLEINYKIKTAILLNYFNLNSITTKDLIYLSIVSYYFFQYN